MSNNLLNSDFLKRILIQLRNIFFNHFEVIIFVFLLFYKIILVNKYTILLYSHTQFLVSALGTALFFAGLTLWFKRRTRALFLITIDILLSVLMFADLLYFRYFNDVISIPVLKQAVFMDSLGNSIFSLLRSTDLYFVADIIIGIIAFILMRKKMKSNKSQDRKRRIISAVTFLLLGSMFITYGFMEINKSMGRKIFSTVLDRTFFVQNVGIVNFHGFDLVSTVVNDISGPKDISDSEKKQIKSQIVDRNAKNRGTNLADSAKGNNLIVIQAEALQNFLIGIKVNGQEVTPNLNKFVKRSAYFNNFFAQAAQGGTSDAEFLTNTSYYPMSEGSVYTRFPNNVFESLPNAMKAKGYKTVAMHAYRASYWNRAAIYPNLGFEDFINMGDYKFDERMGWGLSDKSFFRQSVDKLKEIKQPFEAFIITLSPHHPYDVFENDDGLDVAPYNHTFFGNYLKAQHYADEAFGTLFENLQKSGFLDNSIIVIYGDHAGIQKEKLKDLRDYLGLNSNDDLGWLEMCKVPLIIHFPGDKNAAAITTAGGQVDLFPTLANLFGLRNEYTLGKDLFNTDKGFALFRNGNLSDGKIAYIRKDNQCYDMVSGAKVDMQSLKDQIELTKDQLEISDKVVMHNLIKYFGKIK